MKKTNRKAVRAVPEGFHTVTPYLIADNAAGLIDFIQKAFDGETTFISKADDDKITHATVKVGDSSIMISDSMEGMPRQTAMLYLYLEDVDNVFRKAVQAKGTSVREPKDEFYGDRAGAVKDEWGNVWWISTHIEDVDPEELDRRTKEVMRERKEKDHEVHA